MGVITRPAAKLQGLPRYFTGKPCKRGHIVERYVSTAKCVECSTNCNKRYYKENIEKELIRSNNYKVENRDKILKYRENNKDVIRQSQVNCFNKNKDKYQKAQKEFRRLNPEKIEEYKTRHYVENKHLYMESAKQRKMAKLNRTPSWLSLKDRKVISEFYKECQRMSEETGVKHHVDHEIPLQGENVSGLHVPSNLQILTAADNISKSNQFVIT